MNRFWDFKLSGAPPLLSCGVRCAATPVTAADVRDLVLGQIGNNWDRSNLHNVDLTTALVEPLQRKSEIVGNGDGRPSIEPEQRSDPCER